MALSAAAQTSSADHKLRYENQVKRLGYAGIGVEGILDRWEADFPDDADMLYGKFNYYLAKSISTQVVVKDDNRFLGDKPMLTLKDSLGRDVNYFQETFYDDSLFAISSKAIDKAIKLYPDRLDLRFDKATALIAYEKESPDMTTALLSGLIDYNFSVKPSWKYREQKADDDLFELGIQDFCAALFAQGTTGSYEAFRTLSEKMLKYQPKNTLFQSNLGTYAFVVKKDNKTARKYFDKVLKAEPDNYTAIKNSVLMARREKNIKLEKKYLPMLIKYSPDENERKSAQARLDAFNSK